MKTESPIRDERKLHNYYSELKKCGDKYYVMFRIGVGTGLQLQEILRLKVKQVRGKEYLDSGIGIRYIRHQFRIPDDLREEIDAFTEGKDPEGFLICTHKNHTDQALSREQAYRVLKAAGEKAGIENVGALTMRKTFAWQYYQKTGDIYFLMDLLNHSSPAVTYRFIGITPGHEIGITRKSPSENALARARLFKGNSGAVHIERIRSELSRIRKEMQNPENPDAWFGKTESLLHSIDNLLDQYKNS